MSKPVILDGAMGTMLQSAGMPPGARSEMFGLEHPELLEDIHRRYIEAGSRVIYADTFGANGLKMQGSGHTVQEVVTANMTVAKRAAETWNASHGEDRVLAALDVGPIGELMEPLGEMTFDDAYGIFSEMVMAGVQAGADLIVFETMTDLAEVRAGVLAAKECTDLPVWVTMSFDESGHTFMGTLVSTMAVTLDGLDVDAMGINCSLGPEKILPLIREMREWTDKPLIAKPNAGLPDTASGEYDMDAGEFARQMEPFFDLGVGMVGGCCGTTPDFIEALAGLQAESPGGEIFSFERDRESVTIWFSDPEGSGGTLGTGPRRRGVCSSRQLIELDGRVHVIGECINPTGNERLAQALLDHDTDYVVDLALDQADAGAEILDINVDMPGADGPAVMAEVVQAVQSEVSLPLQIDSSDPAVIEAGLRACCGRAIANSVTAETEKLAAILPIVKKYGAAVVGLTMDQRGIPVSAQQRFTLAEQILKAAGEYGIPGEDVLIDCLTLPVATQHGQVMETLRAVRMVHERLGLHCMLGVSNISFGMPDRTALTTSFLTQAMYCGVDLPILNPNRKEVMDAVSAFCTLSGDSGEWR